MKRDKVIEHTKPAAEPLALLTPVIAVLCTQCLHTARSQEGEGCAFYSASSTPFYTIHSQIIAVLTQSNTGALYSAASMPWQCRYGHLKSCFTNFTQHVICILTPARLESFRYPSLPNFQFSCTYWDLGRHCIDMLDDLVDVYFWQM